MLRQAQQVFFLGDGLFVDESIHDQHGKSSGKVVSELAAQLFHVHAGHERMASVELLEC